MDRKAFFAAVRRMPFRGTLTHQQVEGLTAILDEWDRRYPVGDVRWLAYILATAFHETATTMQPIREMGGEGYFRRMYDIRGDRPAVAQALGNTQPGDGVRFHGRGYVQLTGRRNFKRASDSVGVDLIADPDAAMRPDLAAQIAFVGMVEGWFTGKRLRDYFNTAATDWRGARRIINGLDRADLIAGYATAFHNAIRAAVAAEAAKPAPAPAAPPPPAAPAPATITPSKPVEAAAAAPGGFWSRFAAGVAAAIKGTRNG
jgi:hypothetical protein